MSQPIFAMLSHPGRVRHGNEDACAASAALGAFVVCDGMGGAAAGEVASKLAADTLLAHLTTSDTAKKSVPAQTRLNAAVNAANHTIYQKARQEPELMGMGTTLVALLHPSASDPDAVPAGPTMWLANVGDSRCYLYRGRELQQLTQDHSLVEEQLRAGQITAAEAARSPMRNLITRAVGSQSTAEADIQGLSPQPGDLYLLASDGLTRELTDVDIATVLADIPSPATEPYLDSACNSLVNAANQHGGNDNITVLLLAFAYGVERRKGKQ
jgi:serine/threonine protein phosphatase PrpC